MVVILSESSFDVWHLVTGVVGALIVIIFGWLRRLASKLLAKCFPIATYRCAEEGGQQGNLKHSWGQAIDDPMARSGRVWQHTSAHIGDPSGSRTIYGPYTNDFGKPGYYKVGFSVYGAGFEQSDELAVLLEVTQTLVAYDPASRTTVNYFQMPIGQKLIRSRDLKPKYQEFSVVCYASGGNMYEYRVFVYPSYHASQSHRIRFDTVCVYRFVPGMELV
jgi:hypothetical protein